MDAVDEGRGGWLLAALGLVDLAVIVWLAGGVLPAALFCAFVLWFFLPAVVLAARAPLVRSLAPELRIVAAGAAVIVLAAPWFFLRKVVGGPWLLDVAAALVLTLGAWKRVLPLWGELRPAVWPLRWILLGVVPLVFAAAWCGWAAHAGGQVRFYGLFVVDFGNLVSVVSLLRDAPMLPLSPVAGEGPLSYHWVYFTLPALLGDLFGGRMANANALILCNLLVAALLVLAVSSVAGEHRPRVAFVVLFAPFSAYFYQAAASRFNLGWLSMPVRNHLLLSPVNSMVTFGNNSMALVLILLALAELERWNAEGQWRDLWLGVVALALVIGYSITLILPTVCALLLWTLLGRVRRPVVALAAAAGAGGCAVAVYIAIGVLGGESGRHIAVAFDGGAFLRVVLFGMLPLWVLMVLAGRPRLSIFGAVIACGIVIPSLIYLRGSATGNVDFSMKTGSLLAVAAAPLIAPALSRLRLLALAVILLGVVQSSAYLLQFPFYRLTRATTHATAIPEGYWEALDWTRRSTPPGTIVIDPLTLNSDLAVWTVMLAERRVWLPTPYTRTFLITRTTGKDAERLALWEGARRGDIVAARRMAGEAPYLIAPAGVALPPLWSPAHQQGGWKTFHAGP